MRTVAIEKVAMSLFSAAIRSLRDELSPEEFGILWRVQYLFTTGGEEAAPRREMQKAFSVIAQIRAEMEYGDHDWSLALANLVYHMVVVCHKWGFTSHQLDEVQLMRDLNVGRITIRGKLNTRWQDALEDMADDSAKITSRMIGQRKLLKSRPTNKVESDKRGQKAMVVGIAEAIEHDKWKMRNALNRR